MIIPEEDAGRDARAPNKSGLRFAEGRDYLTFELSRRRFILPQPTAIRARSIPGNGRNAGPTAPPPAVSPESARGNCRRIHSRLPQFDTTPHRSIPRVADR